MAREIRQASSNPDGGDFLHNLNLIPSLVPGPLKRRSNMEYFTGRTTFAAIELKTSGHRPEIP
jgi:hypothetical protein